jgi:hypothetical protein
MATLSLEVSIGEALDKLSILDIKCRKIKNSERLVFCKAEYELLLNVLRQHVERFHWNYSVLTWINESIWNIQDEVRIEDSLQEHRIKQYAMRIQDENDMRFRMKDKINKLTLSNLREQKGYPKRKAFFLGHLGLGDLINHIGAIRYFATAYDEVTVVVKAHNEQNARSFFKDDPSINFMFVKTDRDISVQLGASESVFKSATHGYTKVIMSGAHLPSCNPWDDTSDCFYKDMQLPLEVRYIFHHIPPGDNAMYEQLKNVPYIFVHQTTSTGTQKLITWDVEIILTIDPNINLYPEGHRWYNIAKNCVGYPLVDYITVIQNAKEVHVLDSSFSCLAQYIPLEATTAKCYRRQNGERIPWFKFITKSNV